MIYLVLQNLWQFFAPPLRWRFFSTKACGAVLFICGIDESISIVQWRR